MKNEKIIKRIIRMIFLYKKEVFFASFIILVISIIGISYSYLLSFLIDNVLYSNAKITLITIAIVMLLITFFQLSLFGVKSLLIKKISYNMDIDLTQLFYKKILEINFPFFENHKTGELISRLNDTRIVREAFSEGFISIVTNVTMFFVVGSALLILNKKLFIIQVLSILLLCIVVAIFGKFFSHEYPISMEKYAELQSFITESVFGVESIKINFAKDSFLNRFYAKQKQSIKKSWRIEEQCVLQSFSCSGIEKVTSILLLSFGCLLVMSEKISIGQVASFIFLSGFFTNSVGNLLDLQAEFQEAFAAIKRLFEIFDSDVENEEKSEEVLDLVSDITFQNVFFSYEKEKMLYSDFNLRIHSGEWISFVGKTGCGKTTLIKLLLKLYKPQKGKILWDNIDIKNFTADSIRKKIAYVPQDVQLFSGTVYENITMFDNNVSKDVVLESIKKVGLYEKVINLENGINTFIGERGFSLSGGEKQKLAICRALIKNPSIILMDEVTSNLDLNSEKEIINIIERQRKNGKTIISIAHRLSAVEKCDRIYVLENGKIIEEGSYTELVKLNGYFSKMLNK